MTSVKTKPTKERTLLEKYYPSRGLKLRKDSCAYLGEQHSRQKKSKDKGPEAGLCLACMRNSQAARVVSGAERVRKKSTRR